jgi:hypothetical protein
VRVTGQELVLNNLMKQLQRLRMMQAICLAISEPPTAMKRKILFESLPNLSRGQKSPCLLGGGQRLGVHTFQILGLSREENCTSIWTVKPAKNCRTGGINEKKRQSMGSNQSIHMTVSVRWKNILAGLMVVSGK